MKPKSLVLSLSGAALAFVAITPMTQAAPQNQTKLPGTCSDWVAYRGCTSSQLTLVVTGKCTLPTDGYERSATCRGATYERLKGFVYRF